MTVCCGAGTPVDELDAALAEVGQRVALPPGGTVGGALAVGRSRHRRLGDGPVRDALLQAHYVSAAGEVVKAGGPTVKNVSGFDVCRLLVGSHGTLGLPRRRDPAHQAAARRHNSGSVGELDPFELQRTVFRPASVLWDGTTTWVRLDGHAEDIAEQAARLEVEPADGPPPLPTGGRWSVPPAQLPALASAAGRFVAEVGVGVVHHEQPAPRRTRRSGGDRARTAGCSTVSTRPGASTPVPATRCTARRCDADAARGRRRAFGPAAADRRRTDRRPRRGRTAARLAAEVWGLPEPTLVRLAMNGVFACGDDVVLRVSRPTGDPTAIVRVTTRRAIRSGVRTPDAGPRRRGRSRRRDLGHGVGARPSRRPTDGLGAGRGDGRGVASSTPRGRPRLGAVVRRLPVVALRRRRRTSARHPRQRRPTRAGTRARTARWMAGGGTRRPARRVPR